MDNAKATENAVPMLATSGEGVVVLILFLMLMIQHMMNAESTCGC